MTQQNQETLRAYAENIAAYVNGTPQIVTGGVKAWIDRALSDLPKTAQILELGSGFGRDALYMQTHGYRVTCTDAVPGFVSLLGRAGLEARALNVLSDALDPGQDLIFANAVLLHFGRDAVAGVIEKIFQALRPGGRFAFSVKQGNGEGWSLEKLGAPRFFCYWQQDKIADLLTQAGFASAVYDTDGSGHGSATWLHIVAVKGAR